MDSSGFGLGYEDGVSLPLCLVLPLIFFIRVACSFCARWVLIPCLLCAELSQDDLTDQMLNSGSSCVGLECVVGQVSWDASIATAQGTAVDLISPEPEGAALAGRCAHLPTDSL